MRRLLLVAPLLITVLYPGRPAAAALSEGCCACVAGTEHAVTSQVGPGQQVLFCGFVSGPGFAEFAGKCEDAGGNGAPCAGPPTGNRTCSEILLDAEGLTCPAPAPAPAASDWGLTALALALSGFGFAAMRRRAR